MMGCFGLSVEGGAGEEVDAERAGGINERQKNIDDE